MLGFAEEILYFLSGKSTRNGEESIGNILYFCWGMLGFLKQIQQ